MPRTTATTAKPLPRAKAKAVLDRLVKAGKMSAARAKLIDFREATPAVKGYAKSLEGRARKALARSQRQAA